MTIVNKRIQVRRDDAADWETANPVLSSGEIGYDTTNKTFKIGDGSAAWNDIADSYAKLPAGGTTGQIAAKASDDDYDIEWIDAPSGGGGTWGSITGTLGDQTDLQGALDTKQEALVSGTNIKTVNSVSLLGSGNIAVQSALVSGTNIKTVNGASLLGSGDLAVSGGGTNYNVHTINVKDYGASGSAVETTGGITSGQATLTVSSATSFEIGQDVAVVGAGNKGTGTWLIKTITGIAGNVLTLSGNATATVSGARVLHDDTRAIRDAITALFADNIGGMLEFPSGTYNINLDFDATTNGILSVPLYDSTSNSQKFFGMRGEFAVKSAWNPVATGGTIIRTELSGTGTMPSIFSARAFASTTGTLNYFNAMYVYMKNIFFKVPNNPDINGINCNNAMNMELDNVYLDTNNNLFSTVQPTNVRTGILPPGVGNNTTAVLRNVWVAGFNRGIRVSEHVYFDNVFIGKCMFALEMYEGFRPNWGNLTIESCPQMIDWQVANSLNVSVNLEREYSGNWFAQTYAKDINDPYSFASGIIRYKVTVANAAEAGNVFEEIYLDSPTVGFDRLLLTNILRPNPASRPATPSGSIVDSFAGTNGALLQARTPDTSTYANRKFIDWINTATIQGNAARLGGGVLTPNVTVIKSNRPDCIIKVVFKGHAGGAGAGGVVFRGRDKDNFLYVHFDATEFYLYKKENNVIADYGGGLTSHTVSAGEEWKVIPNGTTVEVYVNGSLLKTYTGVTFNKDYDYVGMRSYGSTDFESFSVEYIP